MLHAIKIDMTTGPVGSKARAAGKSMYDVPNVQRLQYVSTATGETWTFANVDVMTIESSAPVNVSFDAAVVQCRSLLIWDQPTALTSIVSLAADTVISVTVGTRG